MAHIDNTDFTEDRWYVTHGNGKVMAYGKHKGRVSHADVYTTESFSTEQELIDRMSSLGFNYERER